MMDINKKNVTKEKEGNEAFFLIIKTAIFFGIVYGMYKFFKLKEENESLENQIETKESWIKLQEMIIKEKTKQLNLIISKMKPAESPRSWQKIQEVLVWENSELAKKILRKTTCTFDDKN